MISVRSLLFAGALVYAAAVALVVAFVRAATRTTWWEDLFEEIAELPEADPEDPRGRPSQDDRT